LSVWFKELVQSSAIRKHKLTDLIPKEAGDYFNIKIDFFEYSKLMAKLKAKKTQEAFSNIPK